jgi:hypothetical protein
MGPSVNASLWDVVNAKLLLTGIMMGHLAQEQADPNSPFEVLDVRALADQNGKYLPRIEVDLPSGTYTIAVIDANVINEEP